MLVLGQIYGELRGEFTFKKTKAGLAVANSCVLVSSSLFDVATLDKLVVKI